MRRFSLQNHQLESNLERLSYAAMDLLTKVSRKFKHKRSSIIFLIINYAHICQVKLLSCGKLLMEGKEWMQK